MKTLTTMMNPTARKSVTILLAIFVMYPVSIILGAFWGAWEMSAETTEIWFRPNWRGED